MDNLSGALRFVATQFEQLIGAQQSSAGTGEGSSRSRLLWEGLPNLSGVNASEGPGSTVSPLSGSILGTLSGGTNGDTLGGQLGSLLPVANTASAALEGVLQGPLGLITRSLLSIFRRDPEPMSYSMYNAPESLALDIDIGRASAQDRAAREGTRLDQRLPGDLDRQETSQVPVVIQVSTMDARSFADHRDEIATAVREALTRNHALRDEIWED